MCLVVSETSFELSGQCGHFSTPSWTTSRIATLHAGNPLLRLSSRIC